VSFVDGLSIIVRDPLKIHLFRVIEHFADILIEIALVFLQVQNIIASLVYDLLGDVLRVYEQLDRKRVKPPELSDRIAMSSKIGGFKWIWTLDKQLRTRPREGEWKSHIKLNK
jgi:hypothetical protein